MRTLNGIDELEALSGVRLEDPHRPYIDDVTFELEGKTYRRVPGW